MIDAGAGRIALQRDVARTLASAPEYLPFGAGWGTLGGERLAPFMFKRIFRRRRTTLAACTACGAHSVHPVDWSPHDDEHWWMLLRCGACGASREETVPDLEAERYDRELDLAEYQMQTAADRLDHERQVEQTEAFATALELDLIGAEDFLERAG